MGAAIVSQNPGGVIQGLQSILGALKNSGN
jgi:hypothetical protein